MTTKSNDQGRAYEFICLKTLEREIRKFRRVKVIKNETYKIYALLWKKLPEEMKNTYKVSSYAAVYKIFDLEPLIVEKGNDILELSIQKDEKGIEGDVRDLLIIRRNIQWEIGLSIKHNHFAVKHSRLSRVLDFGEKWYGIPCSEIYWNDINPIFKYLEEEKSKKKKFVDLPNKEGDVYIPLLNAFIKEIKFQYQEHKEIASKIVEYLLCKYDFYKVISIDHKKLTQIQSYNLHGTLNQDGKYQKASIKVPIVSLPTRIVSLDFVPNSHTTVELYMDSGWQFSFRIHNAATYVEPSLKFDINIVGMPTAIITINCLWS